MANNLIRLTFLVLVTLAIAPGALHSETSRPRRPRPIANPHSAPAPCAATFNKSMIPQTSLYFPIAEYVPPQPGSVATHYPDLFSSIDNMYRDLPSFQQMHSGIFSDPSVPAREILMTFFDTTVDIGRILREEVRDYFLQYREKPIPHDLMNYVIDDLFFIHPETPDPRYWYQAVRQKRSQEILQMVGESTFAALARKEQVDTLGTLNHLTTFWLELMVGLSVNEWQGNNIHFEAFSKMWGCPEGCGLTSADGKRETDVIWEENDVWHFGEVKFGFDALTKRSRYFGKIISQLKEQIALVKKLGRANDRQTKVDLFYFPGMTVDAWEAITKLGVTVHTKIIARSH